MRSTTACGLRAILTLAVLTGAAGVAHAQTIPRLPSYVVIQEVYAAGGERTSRYASDYVVLINRGTAAVSIAGWSLQVAPTASAAWQRVDLTGSLAGGEHLLVALPGTSGSTSDLPTPDVVGGFDITAPSGKVALVQNGTILAGSCPRDGSITDFVGYGAADCAEGYSAPYSIVNYSVQRHGGCLDTDSNLSDFFAGFPTPSNRASAPETCPPIVVTTYAVSSTSFSISSTGGTLTISVTACSSCAWSASSGVGWLSITGGASGIGSGVVTMSVAANVTGFVRVGTVAIAGITISISQGAAAVTGTGSTLISLDTGSTGDIFTYSVSTGAWSMEFALAGGGFSSIAGSWGAGWTVKACDFNADGLSDFFLYNASSGAWSQAINLGSGAFSFTSGTWSAGWSFYVGEFNGDRYSDVYLYNASSGAWFQCLYQISGGGFSYTSGMFDKGWEVFITDWNADGISDLFLHMMGWVIQVYNLNGFGFTLLGEDWLSRTSAVFTGDFNADGRTDLFLYDSATGVWITSYTKASGSWTYSSGSWSAGWTVYTADFDGNGRSDVFLYSPDNGLWFQCINDGGGGFRYYSGRWSAGSRVYISDFNGDGRSDVLTYAGSAWTQAFNTGLGSFRYASGSWSGSGLSVLSHFTR